MTTDHNVFRTNVQAILTPEALQWAYEQIAKTEERQASLTRDDYYSILDDLYRKLNPPAASGLIRLVRETAPPFEWLDRAIVLNQALIRTLEQRPAASSEQTLL